MLRTVSIILIAIFLRKSQVIKLRNILGKILGTLENLRPRTVYKQFIKQLNSSLQQTILIRYIIRNDVYF